MTVELQQARTSTRLRGRDCEVRRRTKTASTRSINHNDDSTGGGYAGVLGKQGMRDDGFANAKVVRENACGMTKERGLGDIVLQSMSESAMVDVRRRVSRMLDTQA